MLNFCGFIQVYVFSTNHHIKVVIITDLGQRQKSASNAKNTTEHPEISQVPSLCFSLFRTQNAGFVDIKRDLH